MEYTFWNSREGPGYSFHFPRTYANEWLDVEDAYNGGPRTSSPKPFAFCKVREQGYIGEIINYSYDGWPEMRISGPLADGTKHNPGDMRTYDDKCYQAALSQVYEKLRGNIDLSVDIAQMGQVARMVRGSLGIVRYIKSFPSSLFKGLKSQDLRKPVKDLGSKWLEFQYGWKPLAQTLYDVANSMIVPSIGLMVVEGKNTEATTRREKGLTWGGWEETCDISDSNRCLIKCRFRPKESSLQNLGSYTSLNPASIAWELTPWSFVVDWFVDVGGYIRELETSMLYGSLFHDGFRTFSRKTSVDSRVNVVQSSWGYKTSYTATANFRGKSMNRAVLQRLPHPVFPRFTADLGSGRLLNAAALLSQFLGSKK